MKKKDEKPNSPTERTNVNIGHNASGSFFFIRTNRTKNTPKITAYNTGQNALNEYSEGSDDSGTMTSTTAHITQQASITPRSIRDGVSKSRRNDARPHGIFSSLPFRAITISAQQSKGDNNATPSTNPKGTKLKNKVTKPYRTNARDIDKADLEGSSMHAHTPHPRKKNALAAPWSPQAAIPQEGGSTPFDPKITTALATTVATVASTMPPMKTLFDGIRLLIETISKTTTSIWKIRAITYPSLVM